MGKVMEAVFCVFYLVFTFIVGSLTIRNSKNNKEIRLYGIMTLVLVFGDSFHLVPRIMAASNRAVDYSFSLGMGKMITSITMTVFYLTMYFVYEMRYQDKKPGVRTGVILLSLLRIVLCLMPQNDWTGAAPVIWGVYRNIPFALIGLIMVVLYFDKRSDVPYRWMWLAILLSFVFYIPVVLWTDVSPMIGMLMLSKTCMYMWIVVMGYRESKKC